MTPEQKLIKDAEKLYPVNWRHRTPSERVEVFDDGLQARIAYMAGAVSYSKALQEAEKEIVRLKGLLESEFLYYNRDVFYDVRMNLWKKYKTKNNL